MWIEKNNKLYRKFEFDDFNDAFSFMEKVATICKRVNHHPKWTNSWNVVEIWLSTHDKEDSITKKDYDLAEEIDSIEVSKESNLEAEGGMLKLFTDGGSRGNPGPSASGFVILDTDDSIIFKKGIYLGTMTNNQAEYLALKYGVEELLRRKSKRVDIYMDSLLIINQMKGIFKIKNPELLLIYKDIKLLLEKFESVSFTHVPRALNKLADTEVNDALDKALA
jgi:ribonuclease HI/pterin-4a-carbinolamine dehydratase